MFWDYIHKLGPCHSRDIYSNESVRWWQNFMWRSWYCIAWMDAQNGFRPDKSCIDHVYSLTAVLRYRISDKLSTYCAFIDMKKAFDWVNRMLMCKLLAQFGLQGKLYKAIKSIYSVSSACVRVNNSCSDWFDITAGVKQGDTLSPTSLAMCF